MYILAIESSCDDTSVALLRADESGIFVIRQKTASQIDVHKKYGGVIPEIAGRKHAEAILPVVEEVMRTAAETTNNEFATLQKPDYIAVTSGPGLITGLLVGVEVAKVLSYLWSVPVIGINHIEGHIYSTLLPAPSRAGGDSATGDAVQPQRKIHFPAMALIVSGGHTELILIKDHGKYKLIGKTRDDAAGEAFDKVAKLLDMEYPGGPNISACAEDGNPKAINFPRPMLDADNFDFSFAGLKTAVLYYLQDNPWAKSSAAGRADLCASFQAAAVDVLTQKTMRAAETHNAKTIILGGGVSNNKALRTALQTFATQNNIEFLKPETCYTMDNAAMIGAAAYYRIKNTGRGLNKNTKNNTHATKEIAADNTAQTDWRALIANPNWRVYET